MRRVAPWDAPKKLLYLRVFDTSKNSERLLQYTTVVVDSQTDWSAIKQALDTRESTLLEDQVISLNSRKMDKQVLLHLATT